MRGGMRRSVSSTLPFSSQPRQQLRDQQELDTHLWSATDLRYSARDRSRSSLDHGHVPASPESGSSINSARIRSQAVLPPEHDDQPRLSRDVRDHDGVIGQVRAQPSYKM